MKARLGQALGFALRLAACASAASCTGGETNWDRWPDVERPQLFGACLSDGDCKQGSCLCGTCTVTCSSAAACPNTTQARCSAGDSASYLAQCGAAAPVEQGICLPPCGDRMCASGQACVDDVCTTVQQYSGPLVRATLPPRPISGGTLLLIDGGHRAVAADPDADKVHLVDLDSKQLTASIALEPGDEPGRSAQDARGLVHVVLRGGGAIASIDPTNQSVSRREVCQYPRGIAFEPATDSLHVACAGGELITLPAAGGEATRTLKLDDDLRDVVLQGSSLFVSRFRGGQIFVVGSDGKSIARTTLPTVRSGNVNKLPTVAWRMVPAPGGGVLVSHQAHLAGDASQEPVPPTPGAYGTPGSSCTQIVVSVITKLEANGNIAWSRPNVPATLAVDIAPSPVDDLVAIAAAGDPQPKVMELANLGPVGFVDTCSQQVSTMFLGNQVVAVAFDDAGRQILQTREPANVVVHELEKGEPYFSTDYIALATPSRRDTGHDLFHVAMRSGLACASCHPEGREDGHVWRFDGSGERRTQSLGGQLSATAPFHWSGDMDNFDRLVHEVMTVRMSGFRLSGEQTAALSDWIDTIPTWKSRPMADASVVERGRALFESADVGCANCHSGAAFTSNETVDVGTGAPFQVPSLLGVSRRAPFMHDGCASTLLDRFGLCGGGDAHGNTSQLSLAELGDLTSYLDSL